MAWTENPAEPLAAQLDKYKGQALAALQLASRKLDAEPSLGLHMSGIRDGLQAILGFQFGAKGDKVRAARNAAAALAKGKTPVYLGPDSAADLDPRIARPAHLCARPAARQEAAAARGESRRDVSAGGARRLAARARAERRPRGRCRRVRGAGRRLFGAVRPQPRNRPWRRARRRRRQRYRPLRQGSLCRPGCDRLHQRLRRSAASKPADENLTDQSWRRIDADWLGIAADLAMQLDRGVNNTSLVLAFEFIDSGRVVLFPGDAQVGNWLSWQTRQMARRGEGGPGDRPAGADRLSQGRASRQPERDA